MRGASRRCADYGMGVHLMADRERTLWMGIRQALIIALGVIEEYLGLARSIVPRRKRGNED